MNTSWKDQLMTIFMFYNLVPVDREAVCFMYELAKLLPTYCNNTINHKVT